LSTTSLCTLLELFDTLIDAPNGMGNKKYRLILAYVYILKHKLPIVDNDVQF